MKHSVLLLILVALVALAATGRDRLYIEDFSINAGETLQVPVILLNDTAYCGLQTDLYLPEGLSLDMEDDEFIIDLTSRKNNTHTVASRQLDNGAIRIYVASASAREFSGNSGAIMTISITAASNFGGQAVIELKNSICAEAIGTRHVLEDEVCRIKWSEAPVILGDVDQDGIVNINDLAAIIDYLLSGNASQVSLINADCDQDGVVNINDLAELIDMLLKSK